MLEAKSSDPKSRLQLTTTKKGVLWIDQVSAMPTDTYKVDIYICPGSASNEKIIMHINTRS